MKNLFIDSNIWLSLYHFTNDDLSQFEKLGKMLDDDIKLWIPVQVRDEVVRNREAKLQDAFKSFVFPDMKYPAFCKQYLEYKTISEQYISLKKDFESWKKQIDEDVRDESLPADRTINLFFEAVSLLKCDSFIESAYSRYKVGNPPGKDNKYGDAINWECLLDNIPECEDLFFISADKDYRSTLFKDELHPFLRKEWELRKKSKIHFYTALVPFLNEHIESIKLDTENKKMNLIQQLSESGSFVTTHGIIKMMTQYSDWTDTQVEELCEIANKNSQVQWILGDPDVLDFYSDLIANYNLNSNEYGSVSQLKENLEAITHLMNSHSQEDFEADTADTLEEYYKH